MLCRPYPASVTDFTRTARLRSFLTIDIGVRDTATGYRAICPHAPHMVLHVLHSNPENSCYIYPDIDLKNNRATGILQILDDRLA